MLDTDKYIISPLVLKPASQDYEALKAAGIFHIQELASKLWTDYNIHDSGVTILELLSYAITDLGYRTNFDIKDLLTKNGEQGPDFKNTFYSAKEILTCHCTTINDYRKLILDAVPEIKNVWFTPLIDKIYKPGIFIANDSSSLTLDSNSGNNPLILNGLYEIKFELYDYEFYIDSKKVEINFHNPIQFNPFQTHTFITNPQLIKRLENPIQNDPPQVNMIHNPILSKEFKLVSKEIVSEITKKIQKMYLNNRNLGEDIQCVSAIEYEYVGICADIELTKDADPVEIKKAIYRTIYEYISPQLKFYTIEQLLDKGKTIEEIFQGSVPKSGFVDYDELEKYQRKNVLYVSDIINLLMDIPGISDIRKLHFSSYDLVKDKPEINLETPIADGEAYCLHIKDEAKAFKFRLDILEESDYKINKIKFFFDDLNIPVKIREGDIKLNDLAQISHRPSDFAVDLPKPTGIYRDLEKYYSIQNEFPLTYSLGKEGISESASKIRKSQRLQLKAYLTFFEQLLADYLSQLNNASNLLSFSNTADKNAYFFQELNSNEIIDFDKLKYPGYQTLFQGSADPLKYQTEIIFEKSKADDKIFDRRNRFLNMLIARFNDSFVEFSINQFIMQSTDDKQKYEQHEIIDDKKSFLRSYPKIRHERLHAYNYNKDVCNTTNISGYEFLMLKKLGISNKYGTDPNEMLAHSLIHPRLNILSSGQVTLQNPLSFYDNRKIRYDKSFGFHIIEHILLRPRWGAAESLLDICGDEDNFIKDCPCNDPYSFKMTAVMPGWLDLSMNMNFRKYIETTMREELPAHISMKICWVSPDQMFDFETYYFAFTDCLRVFSENNICYENSELNENYILSLNKLIEVINNLRNIYPPSYLVDCSDIEIINNEITKHPVILGRSALKAYSNNTWTWSPISDPNADDLIYTDFEQLRGEKKYFQDAGPCAASVKSMINALQRKIDIVQSSKDIPKETQAKDVSKKRKAIIKETDIKAVIQDTLKKKKVIQEESKAKTVKKVTPVVKKEIKAKPKKK